MIFNSLAGLSLYWLWVVSQGGRGAVVDFCLFSSRCMRCITLTGRWLWRSLSPRSSAGSGCGRSHSAEILAATSPCRCYPSLTTSFLSRKASLIIVCSIEKGHHDMWVSQAENFSDTNTATGTYIDPEAFVAACGVMLHNSPRQSGMVPAEGRARGKASLDFSWSFKNGHPNFQ